MCEPGLIQLEYDEQLQFVFYNKDDYSDITKNGALGFVAGYIKFINQDFNIEFTTLLYNPNVTENQQEINTIQFNNYMISYSTDVQKQCGYSWFQYRRKINQQLTKIMSIIQAYYLGLGISIFFICQLTSVLWVYLAQKQMNFLRQILVLIPVDLILSANIRRKAKEIHGWLYS